MWVGQDLVYRLEPEIFGLIPVTKYIFVWRKSGNLQVGYTFYSDILNVTVYINHFLVDMHQRQLIRLAFLFLFLITCTSQNYMGSKSNILCYALLTRQERATFASDSRMWRASGVNLAHIMQMLRAKLAYDVLHVARVVTLLGFYRRYGVNYRLLSTCVGSFTCPGIDTRRRSDTRDHDF
jgi:hypothetical protein